LANRDGPQAPNKGRLGSVHPQAPGRSRSDGREGRKRSWTT
jgi:hypothetical protein